MLLPNYFDLSSPANARESFKKALLFHRVRRHTLTRSSRLNVLYTLVRDLDRRGVSGDIVECGVCRGGSVAVMARAGDNARGLHLFDSFKGLPPPGDKDGRMARERFHGEWCAGSVDDVRGLLGRLSVPESRVRFHEGWFQDTLPVANDVTGIALLHIDADWYDSVILCLRTFYDRVAPGGYVVLDDFGRWEGCTRATKDFLDERGLAGRVSVRNPPFHYFQKPLS
jgi:O-methyltransferase